MAQRKAGWLDQRGVTLIETMVVVVLIGIITLIGTLGITFYQRYELQSASRQLFGALEKVRQDAMTKRTPLIQSRGFGLRLEAGGTGYTTFEFNDIDGDFQYDGTGEENAPAGPILFSGSITATSNVAGVLLYDERGLYRSWNWGLVGRTYTIRRPGIATVQCIVVSMARIREEVRDGIC